MVLTGVTGMLGEGEEAPASSCKLHEPFKHKETNVFGMADGIHIDMNHLKKGEVK
jgi:hypothetical protein